LKRELHLHSRIVVRTNRFKEQQRFKACRISRFRIYFTRDETIDVLGKDGSTQEHWLDTSWLKYQVIERMRNDQHRTHTEGTRQMKLSARVY